MRYERRAAGGRRDRRRGTALIITTIVLFMVMTLVVSVMTMNTVRYEGARQARTRVQLLAAAEAGVGVKLDELSVEMAKAGASATPAQKVAQDHWGKLSLKFDTITVEVWAEGDIDADGEIKHGLDLTGGSPAGPNGKLDDPLDDVNQDGAIDAADGTTPGELLRIRSVATDSVTGMRRGVEVYLGSATHPLFKKTVYVGNKVGIAGYKFVAGPDGAPIKNPVNPGDANAAEDTGANATAKAETFEEAANDYGDYIEGDVWVNGNSEIRGTTNMYGNLDVTGTADGRPVTGATTTGVSKVPPPDLAAQDYTKQADWVLEANTPTDPNERHSTALDFIHRGVFNGGNDANKDGDYNDSGEYGPDNMYFVNNPGEFDRPNFQFGTASQAGQSAGSTNTLDLAQIDGDGDQLVYIKGNLWLETSNGKAWKVPDASGGNGKKVTIVVEGNLYVSDELSYHNAAKDAFLFIVKGKDDDPNTAAREDESFVDGYLADGTRDATKINGVWDPGEMVINDSDNDPNTYNGPKEGQGNIYFGDRTHTQGGVTDGFMYAQNNGYLVTNNTKSQIFGVRGFFSAGGVLDMGSFDSHRGWANASTPNTNFTNYRVKADNRLADGSLTLKGMPAAQGGGFAGTNVTAWRELQAGDWMIEWD